jgi:hypothetical protein
VGEPFAIVLDGKVLSAPVIQEPITGGSGQISGSFTVTEATSLAALLRADALPAALTVIEERTVGPDLGSGAIRMGAMTAIPAKTSKGSKAFLQRVAICTAASMHDQLPGTHQSQLGDEDARYQNGARSIGWARLTDRRWGRRCPGAAAGSPPNL